MRGFVVHFHFSLVHLISWKRLSIYRGTKRMNTSLYSVWISWNFSPPSLIWPPFKVHILIRFLDFDFQQKHYILIFFQLVLPVFLTVPWNMWNRQAIYSSLAAYLPPRPVFHVHSLAAYLPPRPVFHVHLGWQLHRHSPYENYHGFYRH